jgi:NosR/NirI family nitrous oxide reductase transcriptional regulator
LKSFRLFVITNYRRLIVTAIAAGYMGVCLFQGSLNRHSEAPAFDSATVSQSYSGLIDEESVSSGQSSGILSTEADKLPPEVNQKELRSRIQKMVPEDHSIDLKEAGGLPYAEISDTEEGLALIYVDGSKLEIDTSTFSGQPIRLGVFIDPEGSLDSVNVVSSFESESYMKRIVRSGFYQQFERLDLRRGEQKIDAVTGATISSQAIADTVTGIIAHAEESVLSEYVDGSVSGFKVRAELDRWQYVHIGLIILLFLLFWIKKIRKNRKVMLALSFFSVVYIGFFLNNAFTYVTFLHFFMGTALSFSMALYGLFVLLGAAWDNNTYCRRICPFGNAQRLMLRISPFRAKWKFPLKKISSRIRTCLTVFILGGILLGFLGLLDYEPFPEFFGVMILSPWFWLAAGLVLFSMILPMPWCRFLCPTGAVLDGISRLSGSRSKCRNISRKEQGQKEKGERLKYYEGDDE